MGNLIQYKAPSDIIQPLAWVDDNGEPILFENLTGYGVIVSNSEMGVIGKWGVNIPDFVEDLNIFEETGENTINLNLSQVEYITASGIIRGELYLKYLSGVFPDGERDLISEKKDLFIILQ